MSKKNALNSIIISLLFILLLSACKVKDNDKEDATTELLSVSRPNAHVDLYGKWTLDKSILLDANIEESPSPAEKVFISENAYVHRNVKILKPSISARYVRVQSYLYAKSITLPDDFTIENEYMTIYKFQDDRLLSQEVGQISDNRIIFYENNTLNVYRYEESISQQEEEEIVKEIRAEQDEIQASSQLKEYGLSLGYRRQNRRNTGDIYNYDYLTFYIMRDEESVHPKVTTVNDLVYYKDGLLWTAAHQRVNEDKITLDKIAINPSFAEEDAKVNQLSNQSRKRIDYLNDNYTALSIIPPFTSDLRENYQIHQNGQLALNQPLRIVNVGGNEAALNFESQQNEALNQISSQIDKTLNYVSQDSNIGIQRERMSWNFISNLRVNLDDDGRIAYRNFTLQFIPIIDIASSDNKNISWRDVTSRVPDAITAVVSPEGNFIMIQELNQIKIYSIFNNFISLTPHMMIQNTTGYELVMSKWYPKAEIELIQAEYDKLPKINTQVIYPDTTTSSNVFQMPNNH